MGLFTTAVRADNITTADTQGTGPANQHKVTTFITQEALTYPVAVALIAGLWVGLQQLASFFRSPLVPLLLAIAAVAIGVLITWDDIKSGSKRTAAILLGAFNAGLVWLAVLGIDLSKIADELANLGGS